MPHFWELPIQYGLLITCPWPTPKDFKPNALSKKKPDAAQEPEWSHVDTFKQVMTWNKLFQNSFVHGAPVAVPVPRRLWNVEKDGMQSVESEV